MRIGIDNISTGESTGAGGPGGMRLYLQSLVSEFCARAPTHEFVLLTPSWGEPLLTTVPGNLQIITLDGVPPNRARRIMFQQTALPAAIAHQDLNVFFAAATVAPLRCPVPVVLSVQFTQFYRWPQTYGRLRTAYLKAMLPRSLRKATRAIIFTESAKRDLVAWTGVPAGKIRVVPHGLSPDLWRLAALPPGALERSAGRSLTGGQPYIIYVSATYGYKNHVRLVEAFGALKRRTHLSHALLLVGGEVTVTFAKLRRVAERASVAESVVFAGRLDSYEHVAAAYLGADLAVVPTLYETFGFPVLEPMACGCPVVTSNTGSMAELAGDAAVLVDPTDVDSIAEGMRRVLEDPALRERLVSRGDERARGFTWARSAALTLEVLEEAARQ